MTRPAQADTHTIPEAAAVIGVSDDTVRVLVARGEIPTLRIGRRILIAKVTLDEWLATNTNATFDGRPTHKQVAS
jgi:excisionase family DNA binding protein